jgi:hypothetical protein
VNSLAQSLLAEARRRAVDTNGQPDEILATEYAEFIQDTGRVVDGVTPGFLRLKPRHEVRPAKEYVKPIDALPGEGAK